MAAARTLWAYLLLVAFVAVVAVLVLPAGSRLQPDVQVGGAYELGAASACLGTDEVRVEQSGSFLTLDPGGPLRLSGDRVTGTVACAGGGDADVDLRAAGDMLSGTLGDEELTAARTGPAVAEAGGADAEEPSGEEVFGRLMLAIAAVVVAARVVGAVIGRLGQPPVMGEVLAGILLGPTLLGAVAPGVSAALFPPFVVPLLRAGADIGLAFYMFLVGMELDLSQLRGRGQQAALISHASIALPLGLGLAAALPLYQLVGPDAPFTPFALFMGVAMSITAFPVLARILLERKLLRTPIGGVVMSAAAVDDVTAWGLLALSAAVAGSGSALGAGGVVVLAALFVAAMLLVVRPLLRRVGVVYEEAGHVPREWIGSLFVGVLLASFAAQQIGVAAIFGAFLMGVVLPRRGDLTHDVARRMEDFVVTILLPLFFVVTGLRVRVGLLDRPELWLLTLGLLAVAVAGKWIGATGAARLTGFSWRDANVVGALMNTRGLTELIVLTIGLELGVLTPALFTSLVLVALITTFMAGPAISLLDPRGTLSEQPEAALRAEVPAEERSILVAPQDDANLDALLAVALPLAGGQPARAVVLARLLVPADAAASVTADDHALRAARRELERRRGALTAAGVTAHAIAFSSPHAGTDLVRLAAEDHVDLLLVDGRRPLLGDGVPRGEVGRALLEAPGDVAVLVARGGEVPAPGPDRPVVVPFGGAQHDWAALEVGASLAVRSGAPLRLVGAGQDGGRLLADASLLVQRLLRAEVEERLVEPGREGVLEAAAGAALLVVGLSPRWQQEGLGPVRAEIARGAPAPTLFVRRGTRPGALSSAHGLSTVAWSQAPGR